MDERQKKPSIYTVQISPIAYFVHVVISKKQFLSNFFFNIVPCCYGISELVHIF